MWPCQCCKRHHVKIRPGALMAAGRPAGQTSCIRVPEIGQAASAVSHAAI